MPQLPLRASVTTCLAVVAFLAAAAEPVQAQATGSEALRVFLECGGGPGCDTREFRTELDWVNWVRQRQDAQGQHGADHQA